MATSHKLGELSKKELLILAGRSFASYGGVIYSTQVVRECRYR